MDISEGRAFVGDNHTCIFGHERIKAAPSMSVVYYVLDGDDILISTMAGRAKAKAVDQTGRVSLCILDLKWPLTYLVVYGQATLESNLEQTCTVMMKVGQIMSGRPVPETAKPMVEATTKREDRLVVRVTPEATFYTPPVHLDAGNDGSKLQHGYGESLPWR